MNFLITQDGNGHLVVKNNTRQKQNSVPVNVDGMRNLLDKYKLLCCDEQLIMETSDSFFYVQVPLLNETVNDRR